ncbi:GGDEF domain-containing protein [Pseudoalteromonas sp. SR43-2]|uniref:GGDEF domain-containing protein n=1 Tax=Pseudoalteromonas sp. SR43-2 TaxID=2760944 RepID=UPI0015FD5D11|nr:GGDEF domain-containing protein [Pseudoalteromonas sp. SR43-2]MBB1376747.1 GGDEF domain-containing protein [Pseudoalteromonas sp. SR43-2]
MKANKCGHEWIIKLTQQEEESDLDSALIQIISDLLEVDNFAIYVNKNFSAPIPPTLINPNSNLEQLSPDEASLLLQKVTQNKIRVSYAFSRTTSYVPIYHFGKVVGTLLIETEQELPERTTMLAVHILNIYANQLGLLYKSRLDPLTELLNRQTFDKKVIEIVSGNGFLLPRNDNNKKRRWYLAIADIDNFKNINDNYGHVIGDEVILLVARLLKNNFRIEDYVFRYGGEEFAMLFRAKTEADAHVALNRLRLNVAQYPFPQIGQLTISIGFLELVSIDTVSSIVNQADLALYYSKNTGRNRVTSYSELEVNNEPKIDNSIELF